MCGGEECGKSDGIFKVKVWPSVLPALVYFHSLHNRLVSTSKHFY